MIDKLIEKITAMKNPSVIGIDTCFDYLPESMRSSCKTLADAGRAITDFNFEVIESVCKLAPAVKVQVAYYEMYGVAGMEAFEKTLRYAAEKGMAVIADVKRNDIGSTAGCYSAAYLSGVNINGNTYTGFPADFITVNGYLGEDGIKPFADDCKKQGKGIFVLVKTSNPSSGQLQDKRFDDGKTLFESMGALVERWGEDTRGKYGFSAVGAVVGATHPRQAEILRAQLPHTFFLIPGYGAQGGTADELTVCFNDKGQGGIVNSSRGILCAYRSEKYKGQSFAEAAKNAAADMQQDIWGALTRAGKVK